MNESRVYLEAALLSLKDERNSLDNLLIKEYNEELDQKILKISHIIQSIEDHITTLC